MFGWMETVGGLRETRHRGTEQVGRMSVLVAAACHLVRLPKLLAALRDHARLLSKAMVLMRKHSKIGRNACLQPGSSATKPLRNSQVPRFSAACSRAGIAQHHESVVPHSSGVAGTIR